MSIHRYARRIAQHIHHRLSPEGYYRSLGVRFGMSCRFGPRINWGSEPYLIELGDHVSVAADVSFITHDGGVWVLRHRYPDLDVFGAIKIGNNTFIGQRSIVLPNVTIDSNCVIGAGSVVTKDVPNDSVIAGVPAQIIRTVAEYEVRLLSHSHRLPTKGLSPTAKRQVVGEHFFGAKWG